MGTAPEGFTGKKAGDTVTLPALTDCLYEVTGWKIGTKAISGTTYTVSADDAVDGVITIDAVWQRIDTGVPEFDVTGTGGEVADVPKMVRGQDFVFRIDTNRDLSTSFFALLTAKQLSGANLVAMSSQDSSLAALITVESLGRDAVANFTVMEITVHKELADRTGWTYLYYQFYSANSPVMWMEYEEPTQG